MSKVKLFLIKEITLLKWEQPLIGNIPITPTIIWSNPADIVYGTALSSTQLDAIVSAP